MFYAFRQNNSGGRFDFDAGKGISHFVIIEAANKEAACDRAERIGLYFDGCESGHDCSCCGDRWYPPVNDGEPNLDVGEILRWAGRQMAPNPEGFVHYLDGRVVPFGT